MPGKETTSEHAAIAEENRRVAKGNQDSHKRQLSMEHLPFLDVGVPAMELFDPEDPTLNAAPRTHDMLPLRYAARGNPHRVLIPRMEDCIALWDAYSMLDNIREHSLKVACLARDMARMLKERSDKDYLHAALAAGLLHDLGKTYAIRHGGSHAQLGAAWVMNETRNGPIARAVLFHVHWPWEDILAQCVAEDRFFLTLAVEYADKRVRHDAYVTIDERFDDLLERYGVTEFARQRIEVSRRQGKLLEKAFSQRLEVELATYTPDCRGLVF